MTTLGALKLGQEEEESEESENDGSTNLFDAMKLGYSAEQLLELVNQA